MSSEHGRWWLARVVVHAGLAAVAVLAARPAISYRALDLGVPAAWLGPVAASFALLPLVLAIPLGRWLDRHSYLPVLVAGTGALLVTLLGLAVVSTTAGLIVLTMSLGLAQLAVVVSAQGIVASRSRERDHDRRFGLFGFAVSTGQLVGPMLLLLASPGAGRESTANIFLAGAVAAGCAGLLLAGLRLPPTLEKRSDSSWGVSLREVLHTPGIRVAMVSSLTAIATVDLIIAYLPAVGRAVGVSAGAVGILLALRAAASMVSRAALGWLVQRWGRRLVQTGSLLLSATAVLVVALADGPLTLAVGLAVAGLALGVVQPLTMALVASTAPTGMQGTALSLRLTGNRLGQLSVPLLAGAAVGAFGLGAMFACTAGLLTIVAVGTHRHTATRTISPPTAPQ